MQDRAAPEERPIERADLVTDETVERPAIVDDAFTEEVVALARRWSEEAAAHKPRGSAALLARALEDPEGLRFTIDFVDRVVRPEDSKAAARELARLASPPPKFLPLGLQAVLGAGGPSARLLPRPIVHIARRVLRELVGHLIVDATPEAFGAAMAKLRTPGVRLNINLLGEAVLGEAEARRRLEGIDRLLRRDDVDYVSIKISNIVSNLNLWAFDETVERVVERVLPLYRYAAESPTPKFINLDMEEYRDLGLTVAVFRRLLEHEELRSLRAGIVIQAYLPDALGAVDELTGWARERVLAGGAPIKIRVVKGANLSMERVDAAIHGWPLATFGSKTETDANYRAVIDRMLHPERMRWVHLGAAGQNVFDIAHTHLLAERRGLSEHVDIEMLLGMADELGERIREDVGGLLLYTPVVDPEHFDAAIAYLVRRLEENGSPENFMSALYRLTGEHSLFEREAERYRAARALAVSPRIGPNRMQDRVTEQPEAHERFVNTPDTDTSVPANRAWGREILQRSADSTLGQALVDDSAITKPETVDGLVAATRAAQPEWGGLPAADRARVLRVAAASLRAAREELLEVMASEAGKTLAEGDAEVSEAADFAEYYASLAPELDELGFTPAALVLVVPPWNFPVAIPAGGVLAALAAGAAVILKPAPQVRRSAAVVVQALWDAGVPKSVLRLADVAEGDLGKRLVAHPGVDRVVLTGAYETAELFRSWKPELKLLAETSGKNALVVTPSADLDLAVADLVRSAFGHAGQKCSAASLAILVGSVAESERFERQLVDAAASLVVALPQDPRAQMGALIEPADGKLLDALTVLQPGERWLLEPRRMDEEGRLWSPGIKAGVQPGSHFHRTEVFGPVLGVMTAATLDEAIALQNATDFGLTAGLHSLDVEEQARWLDEVRAGNLYVNRGITGAIVRRQPFGGWKRSAVGPGAKAGGPNYLLGFGDLAPFDVEHATLRGEVHERVARVLAAAERLEGADVMALRAAAIGDEQAWRERFAEPQDPSALGVERNELRYRPATIELRMNEAADPTAVLREIAAALRTGAILTLSLPPTVARAWSEAEVPFADFALVETDQQWIGAVSKRRPARIRLLDPRYAKSIGWALGSPAIHLVVGPAPHPRAALLPYLREQSLSITNHRFGTPLR